MARARLKFDGGDFELDKELTTIGRTTDNDISFPADSNVSRFHAEIELRDGEYFLIDPGSSNGTTLNGERVTGEVRLAAGDVIVFGGSTEAEFVVGSEGAGDQESEPHLPGISEARSELGGLGSEGVNAADAAMRAGVGDTAAGSAGANVATSGSNPLILVAGAVCGLAVVSALAAGAVYYSRGSSDCAATARVIQPEPNDTIVKPTDVVIDVRDAGCVDRAIIAIDGKDAATAEAPAFSTTIDPKDFPELADGDLHSMQVVLVDTTGKRLAPQGAVMLAFETRAASRAPTPVVAQANASPGTRPLDTSVSLVQVQQMSQELVKKFSGKFSYNLSNKQFLQEVQKRIAEYAVAGYFARASTYRDAINVAFVREQNIDPPLGFYLAMSRSRFDPAKKQDGEGLWQMSSAFVTGNAYNGACGTETLSDASQSCAAKAAALYMKAIVFGVFDGDPLYSAAAFGKTPADAAAWKASLPADRSDIWNTIRTAPEREQLVRFFAAGIVAENPERFGLKADRPLSELYRIAL